MTRTYFGGLLAVAGALVCTVTSSSGQVIFSDDFTAADGTVLPGRAPAIGQAWSQTAGPNMTIQGGKIDTTGAGRTAFALLSQPFTGSKRLLKLTADITTLSHNDGYAGISLFNGTSELLFLGDTSGTNPSIGFEVSLATRSFASPVTPNGVVTLLYDSQTGRTALYAGDTITGTPLAVQAGTPNFTFDRIRIQNGNGGDIAVSSITAEMLDQGPVSIDKFEADLPISRQGDNPYLSWSTSFANQVTITPGLGSVSPTSEQIVTLTPGDHLYTITAKDSVTGATATTTTTLRSVVGGESTYRYVRYQTLKTRNASASPWTQLSEFQFFNTDGQVLPVAVTNPGGAVPSEAENAAKLLDNNTSTKWLDYNKAPLVFDLGTNSPHFSSYVIATGNDAPERDPVRWILEGSNDGQTWTLIDNVTAFDFPTPAGRQITTLPIPLPGATLTPYVGATLSGDLATVASGDPLNLTYSSLYAQTLKISDGTTTTTLTSPSGTLVMRPTQETTYTLTATGTGGATQTATYHVAVVSPAITQIAYADFDNSGNELSLIGATVLNDPTRPLPGNHKRLRITDAVNSLANTVWFRKRQSVAQGFETNFGLHITRTDNGNGADGAAFIVQNAAGGSDLAIQNAEVGTQTQALTVGFDTYLNAGDPSAAVLRIASGGTALATVDLTTVAGLNLRSTGRLLDPNGTLAPYAVRIVYAPGSLSVYIDGVLIVDRLSVDLATLGAVDANGTAYVGFAARTGGLSEAHDITSWSLTTGAVVAPSDLKILSSSFNFATNEVTLTWTSATAKTYRVTTSSDLTGWTGVLRSGIPGAASQTTATVPFPRTTRGFFRVEQE